MGNKLGKGTKPSKKGAHLVKSHETEEDETKQPQRKELINEAKEVTLPNQCSRIYPPKFL